MTRLRRFKRLRAVLLAAAAAAAAGCAAPPVKEKPDLVSVRPPPVAEAAAPADGSIYSNATSVTLFENVRARHVGDILTVVLAEKTDAKKEAVTSTAKATNLDLGNPTIMGAPLSFNGVGPLANRNLTLENQVDTSQKFSGQGDSSQSNSLTGNVTVSVVEVLPNGYLVVHGEKRLHINQGDEYLKVSGVVRPIDIGPDNTVVSTQLADARISYSGSGFVADSNHMGWLAAFVNRWWPF